MMYNKQPRDGTLKSYRKNVACRAGSTEAYVAHPVKGDKLSSLCSCGINYLAHRPVSPYIQGGNYFVEHV